MKTQKATKSAKPRRQVAAVVRPSRVILAVFDDSFTGTHRARATRDWLNEFDKGLRTVVSFEGEQTVLWVGSGIVGKQRIERAKCVAKFAEHFAAKGW